MAWATGVCFFLVLLLPGALPRYVLPLGAPIAVLLAVALASLGAKAPVLYRWHFVNRALAVLLLLGCCVAPFVVSASQAEPGGFPPIRAALLCSPLMALAAFILARRAVALRIGGLTVATGAILAMGLSLYTIAAMPWILRRDELRPMAAAIDTVIPAGEPLIVHDPGYLASLFYLRTPYRCVLSKDEISAAARWVLVRGKERKSFAEKRPDLVVAQVLAGPREEEFLLLQQRGETQKLPTR